MERLGMTFGQIGAGIAGTWLAVAYVICMFIAAMFRPQQIRNAAGFRKSYILFALYLIIPPAINALVGTTMMEGERAGSTGTNFLVQLSFVAASVLLASSIVVGLASLRREAGGSPSATTSSP